MEGNKTPRPRRRCLKTCCVVTVLLFILLIGILVLLYFTMLRPKQPEVIAYPVKLTKIDFKIFPQLKLNITLALLVTINNRNYGSFKYKNTTAYVNYRGAIVAEAPIIEGKIPVREKHNISASVEVMVNKLVLNPLFWIDLHVGSLNFTTMTTLQGRVQVFKILKMDATASSMCDINVFLVSKTANSTCNSKFKL